MYVIVFIYFQLDFIYLEGKGGRKKYQCVVASHTPPTGDLTWSATQACALTRNRTGENRRLFGSQARAQSIQPHQPRLSLF